MKILPMRANAEDPVDLAMKNVNPIQTTLVRIIPREL
jgi:hypothetical protein